MASHENNRNLKKLTKRSQSIDHWQELWEIHEQAAAEQDAELAKTNITWANDDKQRRPIKEDFIQAVIKSTTYIGQKFYQPENPQDIDMRCVARTIPEPTITTTPITRAPSAPAPASAVQPSSSSSPVVKVHRPEVIMVNKFPTVHTDFGEGRSCVVKDRAGIQRDIETRIVTKAEHEELVSTDKDWKPYMAAVRPEEDGRTCGRVQDRTTDKPAEEDTHWHFARAIDKLKELGIYKEFPNGTIWGQGPKHSGFQPQPDDSMATPTFYGFNSKYPRPMGIGLGYRGYDYISDASQRGEKLTPEMVPSPSEDLYDAKGKLKDVDPQTPFRIVDEDGKVWLDCSMPLMAGNPAIEVAKVNAPPLRKLMEGAVERPGHGRYRGGYVRGEY